MRVGSRAAFKWNERTEDSNRSPFLPDSGAPDLMRRALLRLPGITPRRYRDQLCTFSIRGEPLTGT